MNDVIFIPSPSEFFISVQTYVEGRFILKQFVHMTQGTNILILKGDV